MPCGISSLLVQVTVVPAFTVVVAGVKKKLSIVTVFGAPSARANRTLPASSEPTTAPSTEQAIIGRNIFFSLVFFSLFLALQRRIDDRETLLVLLEGDIGNAEHFAQLIVRHFHRARRGGGARRRLRESGRTRGVERDVAFHLLHDLVDVAVEHRYRTELLEIAQRLSAVLRAPAPFLRDGPERDMREQQDRRRSRAAFNITFQPFELFVAEIAQTAGLEVDDIDQADEVHAVGIEAVPARALGGFAITLAIDFTLIRIDQVVLARHIVHVKPRL